MLNMHHHTTLHSLDAIHKSIDTRFINRHQYFHLINLDKDKNLKITWEFLFYFGRLPCHLKIALCACTVRPHAEIVLCEYKWWAYEREILEISARVEWAEDPRTKPPIDPSSMTRWRRPLGEARVEELLGNDRNG